jgi:hypothetical protein
LKFTVAMTFPTSTHLTSYQDMLASLIAVEIIIMFVVSSAHHYTTWSWPTLYYWSSIGTRYCSRDKPNAPTSPPPSPHKNLILHRFLCPPPLSKQFKRRHDCITFTPSILMITQL